MKKRIKIFMTIILVLFIFAGCGSSNELGNHNANNQGDNVATNNGSGVANSDVQTVVNQTYEDDFNDEVEIGELI